MKKILLLIIIFTITGCTQYSELNELAIIKSIGIKKENNYTLYAEIIDEVEKNNIPKTKIIEVTGNTVEELFQNINMFINKKIYFSHIDLIIFDEKLNNDDYKNIINYFLNNKEFRNDFLAITSNNIKNILNNSKYDEIEKIIVTNKENKEIIKTSFEEIINSFLTKKSFTVSEINYDKDDKELKYNGNYKFINSKLERINNEEN